MRPSLPYAASHSPVLSSVHPLTPLHHSIADITLLLPSFIPLLSPLRFLSHRFYFIYPPLTPLTSLTHTNTHHALCVLAPNTNWHHTMPTTITSMGLSASTQCASFFPPFLSFSHRRTHATNKYCQTSCIIKQFIIL